MKKLIKKLRLIFISAILSSALFGISSCNARQHDLSEKVHVVSTIFPLYDWTRNIIGNADTTTVQNLIVKNGTDLHNFQPSTQDIIHISEADVFIYVGGESDSWVDNILKNAKNKNMKVVKMMEVLEGSIKPEEFVYGMQAENNLEEVPEDDEHVWLSIKNAKICCHAIADALCLASPKSTEFYKTDLEKYLRKLDDLDNRFAATILSSSKDTLIFCDRFPFRYLVDDYNLKYYAAFSGCSTENEASFSTVAFLSDKLRQTDSTSVLTIEKSSQKIARTVISTAKKPKCDILTIDSLQSTTLRQAFEGKNYISTMEKNLEVIKRALN